MPKSAAKNLPPRPTESELAILRALWRRGRGTVREVCDDLNRAQRTGYTTVLKLMQIMTEKGLVARDEAGRTHVYQASRSEAQTQRQLVRHLLERAFEGSAPKLVQQALAATKTSPAELAEIRHLIDTMERKSS
jgi:BlaI family transcriptional regulator, penicillinase repressor